MPIADESNALLEVYNIGSTVCLRIDPLDCSRNQPRLLLRLRCGDVGEDDEENIPSLLPLPLVTWRHTSLDGSSSAFFAINNHPGEVDDVGYAPPEEFIQTFPGLVGEESPFTVSPDAGRDATALDFSTLNITRDVNHVDYQNLRMAFGWWECTLTNGLGSQTETSFITDDSCEFIHTLSGYFQYIHCQDIFSILSGYFQYTVRIISVYCQDTGSSVGSVLCLDCSAGVPFPPRAALSSLVINPRRACAASSWVCVCLSVCPCFNSPLDCLFVPQTI